MDSSAPIPPSPSPTGRRLGAVVFLEAGEAFAPDLLIHHEAASQPVGFFLGIYKDVEAFDRDFYKGNIARIYEHPFTNILEALDRDFYRDF